MLKEILNKKIEYHKSSGKFSISSINFCWRKKYLEIKGLYKEDFDENTKRIFNIGNIFHRDIINELIEKGNNGIYLVAAEINIPENTYISGRIDVIISNGKDLFIVDIKSASKWTIDNIQECGCPENYKNQVLLYMYLTKIYNGILLFVEKGKGIIEEVEVVYDEEKAKKLVGEIENFMKNYVEKNIEPPKCDGKGMWGCQCCYPKNNIKT